MDYSAIALYFVAVVAYTVSPGPMMAVIITRTIGSDSKGATALATGFSIGFVIAVLAVALGIGVWAQSRPDLLSLGKYFGVAYLLWLAVGMWNGRCGPNSTGKERAGWLASVCAGIALCLGNPATLLIYMILLPIIAPAGYVSVGQMTLVAVITLIAVGAVFFGTILIARQLNSIIATPSLSRTLGRVTAGTLALTSVWMLTA